MKGIIFKDFYLGFGIKKNLISFIFAFLFIVALMFFMRSNFGFLLFCGITLPMLGSSLFQVTVEEDEKTDFDKIQLTYPMTKKEIIFSKYLTGFIMLGLCFILNLIVCYVYVDIYKSISLSSALSVFLFSIGVGLIFNAISFFIFVLLGNKKGVVLYILLIMMIAGFYGATSWRVDYISYIMNNVHMILSIGLIAGIVLMIISYFASLKIYKRRHS